MNSDTNSIYLVILSNPSPKRDYFEEVCKELGISAIVARTTTEAASAVQNYRVGLIVVFSEGLEISPSALFTDLGVNIPRLVMFGPTFGSTEHVLTLELGFHEVWPADISKPVLKALLKTSLYIPQIKQDKGGILRLGDFSIDPVMQVCFDKNRPLTLSTTCFKILVSLIRSSPNVVSREDLLATTPAPSDLLSNSRVVDMHVSRLRKQLLARNVVSIKIIHVRGGGYCLFRA